MERKSQSRRLRCTQIERWYVLLRTTYVQNHVILKSVVYPKSVNFTKYVFLPKNIGRTRNCSSPLHTVIARKVLKCRWPAHFIFWTRRGWFTMSWNPFWRGIHISMFFQVIFLQCWYNFRYVYWISHVRFARKWSLQSSERILTQYVVAFFSLPSQVWDNSQTTL